MTARDSSNGSTLALAVAGLLVLVVALGLWWTLRGTPRGPAPPAATAASSPRPDPGLQAAQPEASTRTQAIRAPAQRIPDQGRLSVTREALREGDILALGLELPDALRGSEARPVRLVDVTGRALDGFALPVDGTGSGLRLEIDPEWLRPGRYMIQVETSGAGSPLPVRRYVLEVR